MCLSCSSSWKGGAWLVCKVCHFLFTGLQLVSHHTSFRSALAGVSSLLAQQLAPQRALLLCPVQAVRRGGARSTLLYNTIGKAQWEVLQLDASVAAGGGLARRVSLLDQPAQAQPQLRAGAHGAHGAPAGGPARHASLPEQQSGLQLHDGVHGVPAAYEGGEVRRQSLPDQQAGEQLRTSEVGESVSVRVGHASVPDRQAGLQPCVNEGSTHEAAVGLQAKVQPEGSLPGHAAVVAAGTAGGDVKLRSIGESR